MDGSIFGMFARFLITPNILCPYCHRLISELSIVGLSELLKEILVVLFKFFPSLCTWLVLYCQILDRIWARSLAGAAGNSWCRFKAEGQTYQWLLGEKEGSRSLRRIHGNLVLFHFLFLLPSLVHPVKIGGLAFTVQEVQGLALVTEQREQAVWDYCWLD